MINTKTIQIQILRPQGIFCQKRVTSINFPDSDGQRAVLYDHAPFICLIGDGIITLKKHSDKEQHFYIEGGLLEVKKNFVIILTQKIHEAKEFEQKELEDQLTKLRQHPYNDQLELQQKNQNIHRLQSKLKLITLSQNC